MSILLDALRKSEEQRHLGAAPTLQTPEAAQAAPYTRRKSWIPVMMGTLTAVFIAWIGLEQFRPPADGTTAAVDVSQVSSNANSGQSELDKPVSQREVVAEADKSAASATTPVKQFSPAAPRPGSPAVSARSQAEGAKRPASKAAESVRSFAREPGSAANSPASNSDAQSESGAESVTPDSATQDENSRLEPYVSESLSYWQLPQSVRESMPELRITVLVYADNAQDRFLLINGGRLREQEELAGGLRLEEIHRDRAIFNFRNYRFYVKN